MIDMATNGEFKQAKLTVPRQSRHNLGNHWVGTLQWGRLTPIYCKQCAPGEVIHYRPNILVQTPPFQSLTFAGIKVKQYSFFVPNRLLWDDFQQFIVGGSDGRSVYSPPSIYWSDLCAITSLEQSHISDLAKIGLNAPMSPGGYEPGKFWYDVLSAKGNVSNLYTRGLFSDLIGGLGLNTYPYNVDTVSGDSGAGLASLRDKKISLLPFRAYQKIWWDWFRDSTLIPESLKSQYIYTNGGVQKFLNRLGAVPLSLDYLNVASAQSPQSLHEVITRNVCYDKDYFTTARTSPQAGLPSLVPVALGNEVDMNLIDINATVEINGEGIPGVNTISDSSFPSNLVVGGSGQSIGNFSVETFRLANSLQRFLERSNVTGTRPLAQLLGRFGVAPSAARLDMAELVGSDERRLSPQQVVSTSETANKALGDRASFGRLFFPADKQSYRVNEHGIFISLLAIVPDVEYCDGIDRMFTLESKEDYFQHDFENLGYEAIYNYELGSNLWLANDVSIDYNLAWGYAPRYSWMKWKRGVLTGDFIRPDSYDAADTWHTFRRQNMPTKFIQPLNSDFVEVHTNDGYNNWNRLFVNDGNDYEPFTVDVFNVNDAVLPMEGYVAPGLSSVYEDHGRKVRIPYGGFRM